MEIYTNLDKVHVLINNIKKCIDKSDVTEEDIYKFMSEELYPKKFRINDNPIKDKDSKEIKYVPLDYFNSKFYLLTLDLEYIHHLLIEMKSFNKMINSQLEKITKIIIEFILKNQNFSVNQKQNQKNNDNINEKDNNNFKNENLNINDINFKDTSKLEYKDNESDKIILDDIEDEFKNIDLESIKFDINDNIEVENIKSIKTEKNDRSSSDIEDDKVGKTQKVKNKKKNNVNTTSPKINFLAITYTKDNIYKIYDNLLPYANLESYKVIEEKLCEDKFLYYIYIRLIKKRRLFLTDFLDAKFVDFNFKNSDINDYLDSKGPCIFNPLKK